MKGWKSLDELHALASTVRRVDNLMWFTADQLHTWAGLLITKGTFLKELDWLPERKDLRNCREVLESICEKLIGFESVSKPDGGLLLKERSGS